MAFLSVIIPTSKDSDCVFLKKALQTISSIPNDIEVICVDFTEGKTRAERLNIGFQRSRGSMILFHHPRSYVDVEALTYLLKHKDKIFWGGLTHRFDIHHPLLRFTSWYSNEIRGRKGKIIYLDHCIFFHRSLWKQDLPAVEIFEDTLLSQNLKLHSDPEILPFLSITSAIRFQKNGIWKQALMNQLMKVGFHFGVPFEKMNRLYEKRLHLNSKR